ncbi:Peptidyl-prolyl cis-trans isomerase G [Sarcoptes scabiei]|uniref:peptidylprolyl isomerase n=1 Tax=Sarcoptes scabiei TaxID=52283 RepID=A0A834RFK6_SARSC|nr:Peptidyl-prolyl cis-trans isomerase G [Sarcoptes scabiei]
MGKLKKLRPRCFFDISIDSQNVGRIVFELFDDVCPKTCENFKALCTGERGVGMMTQKPLHYKNISFHRIVKNFIIQSGDFSQGNGKGGESIYGGTFEDESFHFKHEKPFLLSMANKGKNTNGSQFFITLAPAPHLDGVHVVFGHVISGKELVSSIADVPVDKQSRPTISVVISNCGELVPQIKSDKEKSEAAKRRESRSESGTSDSSESSSESDDSSDSESNSTSDSDSAKQNRHQSRTKEDRGEKSSAEITQKDSLEESENSIASILLNPKYKIKINPDEIPEIPKNKFLDRNRIKGRGNVRYRSPSPSDRYRRHRRSETPPHWRRAQDRLRSFDSYSTKSKRKHADLSHERDNHRDKRDSRREESGRFYRNDGRYESRYRDESNHRSSRNSDSKRHRHETIESNHFKEKKSVVESETKDDYLRRESRDSKENLNGDKLFDSDSVYKISSHHHKEGSHHRDRSRFNSVKCSPRSSKTLNEKENPLKPHHNLEQNRSQK